MLDSVLEPTSPGPSADFDQTTGPSVDSTTDIFTIRYHPHSGRPSERRTFTDYIHKQQSSRVPLVNDEPWRPFFNTREDFEFAQILMEAGVTKDHSDRLLKLFKKCLSGNGVLTYSNHSEIKASWDRAETKLTAVSLIAIPQERH